MLAFIGDIHGERHFLNKIIGQLPTDVNYIIQVGDYGLWPMIQRVVPDPIKRVLWIHGNHEYFPMFQAYMEQGQVGWSGVEEIRPNSWYVPSGTVLELCGWRIGFLGGADSIDRDYRTEYIDWFKEERITEAQMRRLYQNIETAGGLDLLVTHTPPLGVLEYMVGLDNRKVERQYAYSAMAVQLVWDHLKRPPIVCGHMHPKHPVNYLGCLVLPINGVHLIHSKE